MSQLVRLEGKHTWQNAHCALHCAAELNPAAVQVLVQANAKVNVLSKWNWSPLYEAAYKSHSEAVVCLCKAGADPYLGNSPLSDSDVNDEMKALIKQHAVAPWLDLSLCVENIVFKILFIYISPVLSKNTVTLTVCNKIGKAFLLDDVIR